MDQEKSQKQESGFIDCLFCYYFGVIVAIISCFEYAYKGGLCQLFDFKAEVIDYG